MFHPKVKSSRRHGFAAGAAGVFLAMLGLSCLVPEALFAQAKGGRAGGASRRGGNSSLEDEMMGMPGRGGGGGMGIPGAMGGGARGNANAPRRKATKLRGPAGAADEGAGDETDPDRLPRGFAVPQEPPDWLTTTDEWVFEPFQGESDKEKKRDETRKVSRYKDLAQKGDLTKEEDKQLMAEVIEWKLSQMTRKENREKAFKIRDELFREIKTSGTGRGGKLEARVFMMQTVIDKAPKLFSYHFAARLNGAILLADLSEVNEKEQDGRNPPVRFIKAYTTLIDLLKQVDEKNRKQPDAVRIWAVDGLMRIGAIPETRPQIRGEIVDALVEQMGATANDHEWLQWRIAESLGILGVAYNSFRKPIVPQVLAEVLVDPKRPWLVRAEAAQSLGKLPLDRDIDLGLIAREVAHLAAQMADAYQKKPEQTAWKLSFLKLYLAFKPANDEDAKKDKGLLTQATNKAPLSAHKRSVQEAYDVVVPIVQGVVSPPQDIERSVIQLKDWLSKNPPRTTRIAEKEEPIIKVSAPQSPPAAEGNAAAG